MKLKFQLITEIITLCVIFIICPLQYIAMYRLYKKFELMLTRCAKAYSSFGLVV